MSRAPKQYFMEPINLTPEQDDRLVRALAVFKAKCAALDAGMSLDDVQANTWVVDVHPVEAEAV